LHKDVSQDCGYKVDLLVEEKVILELKATEPILPGHEAQLLTCLRLTNMRLGCLTNFHVNGI